jgi:hypothetical protein
MSLVASPPPVCDCCGDFPGLAEGGSEKALISLAALGSLAAAELNRRVSSAGVEVLSEAPKEDVYRASGVQARLESSP